jgi:signal transduction histidine kinase
MGCWAVGDEGENKGLNKGLRAIRPPSWLVATAAVWVLSFLVWTASAAFMAFPDPLKVAGRRLLLCLVGAVLCAAMHLVLRLLRRRPLGWRLAAGLPLAVLAAAAFIAFEDRLYHNAWKASISEWYYYYRLNITAIAALWTFLTWCGVYFALQVGADLGEKERRLAEAEAMAVDAQNRMLRYQINPHFLFNIHNALSTLIHEGANDRAERMLLSLSAFLRRSLEKDPLARVTLEEELEAVREYLRIEQLRFGERLNVLERIEPGLGAARVPSFLLQPLVENAIKHGLGATAATVTVEVAARSRDAVLELAVRDDGPGPAAGSGGSTGVGLANVRRRLESLYGARARLEAGPLPEGGFGVTLALPLERD